MFQKPLEQGADLVMYSLTKYVGGHSDLVAGGVVGPKAMVLPVRQLRSALGTQLDPNTSWMIMRSMETLALRMRAASDNAARVAGYLAQHPKVASVNYLGHLKAGDPRSEVFARQCQSAGSTFAFSIRGGEAEAFRMLDALTVMKLAVSLGGTETLISHPASTTHSGVPKETRDRMGVTDALIRISVGIENAGRSDRGPGAGAGAGSSSEEAGGTDYTDTWVVAKEAVLGEVAGPLPLRRGALVIRCTVLDHAPLPLLGVPQAPWHTCSPPPWSGRSRVSTGAAAPRR